MTTALVIKIVLPVSLIGAALMYFATVRHEQKPPHFNARQQQTIQSLTTARDSGKDLK